MSQPDIALERAKRMKPLILRRPPFLGGRLEGWMHGAELAATLRDAVLRAAPQDEVTFEKGSR